VDTDRTTNIEVSTVFDGLILGVIPFIEEDGRITLLVNPINSDVDEDSLEPVATGGGESISLPIVRIKEISTTIALNSGDIVILGGLIDKQKVTRNQGIPILSAIPGIGYLFRDEHFRDQSRELVIVLSVRRV
jgi:type II secretory pathway component GspD/PulD (secretin)